MTKIVVKGWKKDALKAAEMHVHLETPGYVWFEIVLRNGEKTQTGLLKEAKVC